MIQSSAQRKATSPAIPRGRDGEECLGNRDVKVTYKSIVTKTADKGLLITPAKKESAKAKAHLDGASARKEASKRNQSEHVLHLTVDGQARGDEQPYHSYSQTRVLSN